MRFRFGCPAPWNIAFILILDLMVAKKRTCRFIQMIIYSSFVEAETLCMMLTCILSIHRKKEPARKDANMLSRCKRHQTISSAYSTICRQTDCAIYLRNQVNQANGLAFTVS